MAPQKQIPLAANVLGTIGTVFWCVQLVPQIWTNWKKKKTEGLPAMMMFLWAVCGVPFGAYAIIQNFNIPVQIQPQIFAALSLVSWAQVMVYGPSQWSTWNASMGAIVMALVFGGVEALLILTLRGPYSRGITFPIIIVGVVAAVLLAAGLIPPYFEIWKRKGRVVGISFIFLSIDWLGAFFSLMALVAQNTFDVLGGSLYIVCLILELGIFASHGLWLLRTRKKRRAQSQRARIEAQQQQASPAPRNDPERDIESQNEVPSIAPATPFSTAEATISDPEKAENIQVGQIRAHAADEKPSPSRSSTEKPSIDP